MLLSWTRYESPVGKLFIISSERGLFRMGLPNESEDFLFDTLPSKYGYEMCEGSELNQCVIDQLERYFNGQLKKFELRLDVVGTEFQTKVWNCLQNIPYGQTISYKELASAVGIPNACRAVGAANSRNPIPIVIPCHRVIGSNGSLVGFGGGLDLKRTLLRLEGYPIADQV